MKVTPRCMIASDLTKTTGEGSHGRWCLARNSGRNVSCMDLSLREATAFWGLHSAHATHVSAFLTPETQGRRFSWTWKTQSATGQTEDASCHVHTMTVVGRHFHWFEVNSLGTYQSVRLLELHSAGMSKNCPTTEMLERLQRTRCRISGVSDG